MQVQIGTSSFFVFVVPFMLVDPQLDLTPGSLGGMYAVGGLLGALVTPFFGRLVDKLGSRVCLPLGFIGLSIALQVLSNASNTSMVMAGFFGCRLFAIGALNPWSQVTINQWFDRKRGRVMGIMMVTTTFIRSGPYAVVYEAAISAFGWRTTQRYGSQSCWLLVLPVMLLIFHRPEDVGCSNGGLAPADAARDPERVEAMADEKRGLTGVVDEDEDDELAAGGGAGADGAAAVGARWPASQYAPAAEAEAGRDYTLREALRTFALYLLNLDTLVGWMFGAGIGFHMTWSRSSAPTAAATSTWRYTSTSPWAAQPRRRTSRRAA
jgi:MFS family permease